MNDRLKYRVWDIRNGEYFKDPNPTPPLNSDGTLGFTYDKADFQKYYIIEQCTGLKDKNGNLIYEWDIVSGRYFNPHHPKTPNPKIKGTIKFIQDRMTWIIEDGDCGYDLEDCMPIKEYFEIIGNIHTGIKGE